jgi:hypothetical protein
MINPLTVGKNAQRGASALRRQVGEELAERLLGS